MTAPLRRPRRLKAGDRVAAVSPSWGGPAVFPARYAAGKAQLQAALGVTVVEMAHTLAPADWLAAHPEARARDLVEAFADPAIDAIVATIGGEDSIRLLPYLDLGVIAANPKIFLGFSDTTSLHLACRAAGIVSFYGPSIMAGFAENGGMHDYTLASLRHALLAPEPFGLVPPNTEGWTAERFEWSDPALQAQRRRLQAAEPPRILQGHGIATGPLIGGCAEVLEMAKGTPWWPPPFAWDGAILVYETSEDRPPANFVRYWLRNYAAQGTLQRLNGLLLARPDPGGDPTYREQQEASVLAALHEYGLEHLPVLSGLDFGHTQPMLTLPLGVTAQIDCERAGLTILEAGVSE